jgi:predicted Rossmann-fold nucleotide-binding protein
MSNGTLVRRKRNGTNGNEIARIEETTSGKKPIGPECAARVHSHLIHGAYHVQLTVEEMMLRSMGFDRKTVKAAITQWKPKKARWVKLITNDSSPLNVWWGSARKKIVEQIEFEPLIRFAEHAAKITVKNEESIIHGSSTTGCMGLANRCFVDAARAAFGADWRTKSRSRLYTIPLHWRSDEITELAAKDGAADHRCPPHVKITDRTADFFVKEVERIFTLPGGMGSFFEIFFYLINVQLSGPLCTVASTWKRVPPLFLLDYQPNNDWSDLTAAGVDIQQLGIGNSEWYWQDLFLFLLKNVRVGTFNQRDVDRVYIIRIGKGQNYDLPVGQHVGPRVLYFDTPEAAAEFTMSVR